MPLNPPGPRVCTKGDPMPGNPARGSGKLRLSPPSIPPPPLVESIERSLGTGKPPSTGKPDVAEAACCCPRLALNTDRVLVAIRSRLVSSGENLFIVNIWASLQNNRQNLRKMTLCCRMSVKFEEIWVNSFHP